MQRLLSQLVDGRQLIVIVDGRLIISSTLDLLLQVGEVGLSTVGLALPEALVVRTRRAFD